MFKFPSSDIGILVKQGTNLMRKFNERNLCHKREGSDCLIKTQDSAKLKNDV